MASGIVVELFEPFQHHDQTITSVTVKEPTAGLFAQLGDPRIAVRTSEGGYYIEQPTIVRGYLDKAIDHQDGAELMKLMSLADAIQIKNTLLGFFDTAAVKIIERRQAGSSSA